MSFASSTESDQARRDTGMQPWHFYLLLAMIAATVAVVRATDTHPAALLLLSAAVIASGAVAIASHYALTGFFSSDKLVKKPLGAGTREGLEQDKALVLRSLKELEFDHAMRKISDADFAEIGGRLRSRAMDLMEQLDRPRLVPVEKAAPASVVIASVCPGCETPNDADAKFCKSCGTKL